ncbi:hypothetical protein N7517_002451 [Penicillium concentricum]|uniref:Uncharacterized protein n=1 Tax=Penicillium concentricum TaxID=293559 RepID=A0A9W9SUR5_9EURO|nr:uncharacterized protein N7517_002451 [Penicillium concentricum]KAJ5384540.1 hypothetical protein N7517_002451 [Penicillium concentricum]
MSVLSENLCKKPTYRDTAIRHEKAAHETEYSPRTVPDENIIVSAVPGNTSRYHYDPPADSRGPGPVQSEDRTALAVTEQPVSTYSPYTTSSSPNERIQQALTILDFTSLHSEALSANHLTVPHPTPLSETEFMHREITYGMDSNYTWETSESFCTYEETPSSAGSDFDEAATPPSQSSAAGQTQHCNYSRVDLTLSSGLMFDPLWDPIMSRKAAVTAYATDLHQEILRSQGFT